MSRISLRRTLCVALVTSLAVAAVSVTAALAAPQAKSWEADASFARPNLNFPAITWQVDLRVVSSEGAAPVAYADFRSISSDGSVLGHLTGSTTLDPSQVTFGLNSTTVRDVTVHVTNGVGFQNLTFNVSWTRDGDPTAVNSRDDGHTVTQLIPTSIGGTATMLVLDTRTFPFEVVTFTFGADDATAWSLQRVLMKSD